MNARNGILCISIALLAVSAVSAVDVSLAYRPLLAGRALLAKDGFVVRRALGTANFSPELRLPIELVYESASERTGLFGFAWRSPQLESFAAWERDGVVWTSPWGERLKFFPKKERPPKDAVKLPLYEAAKMGRGYYSPYAEWEADSPTRDPLRAMEWKFSGKGACRGWSFTYRGGRLARVAAPSGRTVDFIYEKDVLKFVSQDGRPFIEIGSSDGLAQALTVNGVVTRLAYGKGNLRVLPKTLDGQIVPAVRPRLASIRRGDLDPVVFAYEDNYLSSIREGGKDERLVVQTETLEDRRRNLRAAAPKSRETPSGKVAGRLLSDGDYDYAYDVKGVVTLTGTGRALLPSSTLIGNPASSGSLSSRDGGMRFTISCVMTLPISAKFARSSTARGMMSCRFATMR